MNRKQKLMPNNIPRYIRIYDNFNFFDRYTVVFTKKPLNILKKV
jgi:hypothetical protein